MDVYERRKAIINIIEGNFTQEDARILSENSLPENYGKREQLAKEDVSGRKISVTYMGNTNPYFIPSEGEWMNRKGISIERAYRIFKEDDKTIEVGKVQDFSELEKIAEGIKQEIIKLLNK